AQRPWVHQWGTRQKDGPQCSFRAPGRRRARLRNPSVTTSANTSSAGAAASALFCFLPRHSTNPLSEREPMKSTTLASAGYDANLATLELQSRSGAVHQYFEVPERVFQD